MPKRAPKPPKCVNCRVRPRQRITPGDGGKSFYAAYCFDCGQAALAYQNGWPVPRIGDLARPPDPS